MNLVSSRKLTTYMSQNASQTSVKMSVDDLQGVYSKNKARIVLLYPFPAIGLGPYSADPILQLEGLQTEYAKESTLLVGVSH